MIRKKWIVVWKINTKTLPFPCEETLELMQKQMGRELFSDFFGTDTLVFFLPIRNGDSQLEVHEIILDEIGYDKYEIIVQNTNLNVRDILDQLKDLLDVESEQE